MRKSANPNQTKGFVLNMKKFKNINEDNKKNCVLHSKRQRNLTLFIITAFTVAIAITVVIMNIRKIVHPVLHNKILSFLFISLTLNRWLTFSVFYFIPHFLLVQHPDEGQPIHFWPFFFSFNM